MSRIGKLPIPLPSGVEVTISGQAVTVKGPKGTLSHTVVEPITIEQGDGQLLVKRPNDERDAKARHGLTRTLVANMVTGVTTGYRKGLEITGVGYRAQKIGEKLQLSLGYSHPVEIAPPPGISFELENPTHLSVVGIDKQLVGEVAAAVRSSRKPEPYKGKGVRYAGEQIRRKAGKAGEIGGKK